MRFGWWAPWKVTDPWLLYGWRGTDEWHNPAVSIVVPFLGAFHLWFRQWRDGTDGHFTPQDSPGCPVCFRLFHDLPIPEQWWWNPPRPSVGT